MAIATASPSLVPPAATGRKALSVLIVSTLAFTVCFMVWMMFGVIGISFMPFNRLGHPMLFD